MTSTSQKGTRGFEVDMHVAFRTELPRQDALNALLVLEGFTVTLYQAHPNAMPRQVDVEDVVPSARLTGPLRDREAVQLGLTTLLGAQARYVEVGLRGFLRSADGATEWMPWRRNVTLPQQATAQVNFEEGVRYVLE